MGKKDNIHAGHRQRLKERIVGVGIENLPDHELLEFILSYCIPYKDTNALAHILLNRYGSISSLFNQSIDELCTNTGVSTHTALMLSSLPRIFERYNSNNNAQVRYLNTVADCIRYFQNNFVINNIESFYLVCLAANNSVINKYELNSGSAVEVTFDIRTIAQKIIPNNTSAVVLFHTHPHGHCTPSESDIRTTAKLLTMCHMLGIKMHEHLIFTKDQYYSFGTSKMLDALYSQVKQSLGNIGEIKTEYQSAKLNQKATPFSYENIDGTEEYVGTFYK